MSVWIEIHALLILSHKKTTLWTQMAALGSVHLHIFGICITIKPFEAVGSMQMDIPSAAVLKSCIYFKNRLTIVSNSIQVTFHFDLTWQKHASILNTWHLESWPSKIPNLLEYSSTFYLILPLLPTKSGLILQVVLKYR